MKSRISILILAVGIAALALSGCTDKETQALYQQAITQLAAQSDSIRQLQVAVASKSDSLNRALESVDSTQFSASERADSLQQRLRQAAGYASNLKKSLAKLQDECSKREAELLTGIRERDSVLTVIDALFSDTNMTLTTVRGELSNEKTRAQFLSDLLGKVRPWYKKWKHDSKRSFLKVLFAAGKAKTPDFPEPNLDSLVMPVNATKQLVPPDTTTSKKIQQQSQVIGEKELTLLDR